MGGHLISNTHQAPCINYEYLLQTALDPIIVRDLTSAVISWNQGATQLYGWSAQEAIGQITHTLLQTRFPTSGEEVDIHLIEHGHWEGLLYHINKAGQQIIVESHQQLVRDDQGQPTAILEMNRNITYHKRTEEALQFLAEVSRTLSSSLDYNMTLHQVIESTVPLYADVCFIDLLNADTSLQRIVHKRSSQAEYRTPTPPLTDFVPVLEQTDHPVIKVLQSGQPEIALHTDEEWFQKTAISQTHYDHLKSANLCSLLTIPLIAYGKTLGTLTCCYTEASHRIYTEQELELLQELASRIAIAVNNAQLYAEQVEARKQAEALAQERKELDQQKDTFISMASHELRNPLTSIHANLQLAERRVQNILKQPFPADLSANIERATQDAQLVIGRALRQTKVMNRLIGDLLDGTRIQTNKLTLAQHEYDIQTILQEVVQDQRDMASQRTIQLEVADSAPMMVLVDKDRIGQVVSNYLTNALKYSTNDKEVVVGLQRQGQQVQVWVRDKGPGLTPEQQELIWHRYYQAKDVIVYNNTGVGLGLGLHISKTLITRHGGQVGVDSTPGIGSTFWFTLPLAKTVDESESEG